MSLYNRMVEAGIDMSWYDKSQSKRPGKDKSVVPLNDDRCSVLSIYLLEPGGKLHTTKTDGEPYMLARFINSKVKKKRYLCASCGEQFSTYDLAREHYEKAK